MITFGVDHIQEYKSWFAEARIGILTNITGRNSQHQDTIQLLMDLCHVTALFAPEHGIRGDKGAGEAVETYVDQETGLLVYSYMERKRALQRRC